MRLECYCIRGGNYARNGGRVVGSTEFRGRAERIRAERERERERESLLQTSDVMMMEKEETIARLFFGFQRKRYENRRAIVGSRRSIMFL